jgi:hypothetical protein
MSPQNGVEGNFTGLTEGGLSAYPAGLTSGPIPASNGGTPRQAAANIGLASPSKASQRELAASPKPASRAQSRTAMDQRPWSPMSGRSKALSPKGTAYPPLPESRMGDYETQQPLSPVMSRARSKAPSISPSDSPSQRPKESAERVQMFAQKSPYSNGGKKFFPPFIMSIGRLLFFSFSSIASSWINHVWRWRWWAPESTVLTLQTRAYTGGPPQCCRPRTRFGYP